MQTRAPAVRARRHERHAFIDVGLALCILVAACATRVVLEAEAGSMTAPLIDTRLLGKPPKFEGDINHWKQWRFQTLAYFGALDPELHEDLKLAESIPGNIAYGDLSTLKQGRAPGWSYTCFRSY